MSERLAEMKRRYIKKRINCAGILNEKRHVFMEGLLLRNGLNDSQYYHRIQVIPYSITDSHNKGRKNSSDNSRLFHG